MHSVVSDVNSIVLTDFKTVRRPSLSIQVVSSNSGGSFCFVDKEHHVAVFIQVVIETCLSMGSEAIFNFAYRLLIYVTCLKTCFLGVSGQAAWQALVAYDACVRLCLRAWARGCMEAPEFLLDECSLLQNCFG